MILLFIIIIIIIIIYYYYYYIIHWNIFNFSSVKINIIIIIPRQLRTTTSKTWFSIFIRRTLILENFQLLSKEKNLEFLFPFSRSIFLD